MLKKYYRSRYATFLKALQDKNKKREQELEEIKRQEEKKKAKLKEEIGISNVQSRFLEDKPLKEEPKEDPLQKQARRGSSVTAAKSLTSTSSFSRKDPDSMSHVTKVYEQSHQRGSSKSQKRALTPKQTKRVVIMPIDERNEEELEKEQKAKREAAEKIRQRQ